jgi:hypothetical protein
MLKYNPCYSLHKIDKLWDEANIVIDDSCFGLKCAEHWHPTYFGTLGYAMLESKTIRDSLQRLHRFHKIVTGDEYITLENGKDIREGGIHGESIGMILFRNDGPGMFRKGLEKAVTEPSSANRWYLSVIDAIALKKTVLTCSIGGLLWCEVDYPVDLKKAVTIVTGFHAGNRFDSDAEECSGQKTRTG